MKTTLTTTLLSLTSLAAIACDPGAGGAEFSEEYTDESAIVSTSKSAPSAPAGMCERLNSEIDTESAACTSLIDAISSAVDASLNETIDVKITETVNSTIDEKVNEAISAQLPPALKVQSAHSASANNCPGVYSGGLCSMVFYVDVTFPEPFAEPPHVLVTAEDVSNIGGCVGSATDYMTAYPTNITATGFRLYASGSPVNFSCGSLNGYYTPALAGWMAIGH